MTDPDHGEHFLTMSSSLLSDTSIITDTALLSMKLEALTNGHQAASNGNHLASKSHQGASNGLVKLEDPGDSAPALPPRLRQPPAQEPGPGHYANEVMGDHYEMIRGVAEEEVRQSRAHHRSREMPGHVSHVPHVSHVSRCRQRVASPCRDDYKDFSALRHREMISPCRWAEAGEVFIMTLCHSCHSCQDSQLLVGAGDSLQCY